MFGAIIRQLIDTFIVVYDKIVPFDAKKGEDGKIRRKGLRIFLVIFVIILGTSKSISEPFYDLVVRIASWALFILIIIAYFRYKNKQQQERKKAEEEWKRQEL